jgi:hypothetical protein
MAETREILVKRAKRYAVKLGYEPREFAVSKMKKPELVAHVDSLLTEIMIKDCIEEAEYKERGEYESNRMLRALVTAIIRENKLTSKELVDWSLSKLIVTPQKATEDISIRSRASIWSRYADASIVLEGTNYEVKNVNVWCHVQGI